MTKKAFKTIFLKAFLAIFVYIPSDEYLLKLNIFGVKFIPQQI